MWTRQYPHDSLDCAVLGFALRFLSFFQDEIFALFAQSRFWFWCIMGQRFKQLLIVICFLELIFHVLLLHVFVFRVMLGFTIVFVLLVFSTAVAIFLWFLVRAVSFLLHLWVLVYVVFLISLVFPYAISW